MKRYMIAIAALLIVGLSAFQSCQSTKTSTASKMLKFNFENGRGYDYEMKMDMDQEIEGKENNVSVTTYYAMDVVDAQSGIKTITTTFKSFKMVMQMMGMTIDIDSDKPAPRDTSSSNNPLTMISSLFRGIKGQKFQMKVSEEGKVVEVTGVKQLAQNIIDSMVLNEEYKEMMTKSFSEQFNDESIREQFEQAFFIFPNKEVKVGDSWEKSYNTAGPAGGSFVTVYTVDEIEGEMVTLDLKSKISRGEGDQSMKGVQSGTMVVDSRTGLIMQADLDQEIEGTAGLKMKAKSRIRGKERN